MDVKKTPEALKRDIERAIADATSFDPRDVNTNFEIDYEAYEAVKRGFEKLIAAGSLEVAMELSVSLMKQGSRQVEMSDEGLMTGDVEDCLQVVIRAVKISGLAKSSVRSWSKAMTQADRSGFICHKELAQLFDET